MEDILKLAVEWPGFVDTITQVVDEFRQIHDLTKETKAYTSPF